ncbi:hypothetical protein Cch01nite_40530 [Cellulomonas chitinilytica]|uniref:HNH nuclease domain-containing protein n=1 Tax=Cellulomonas chitinilytica TaxID=398759 RepID=A0A919P8Q3_9CELL|nr:hypothetical protein Cch01nite_40530 [Cellulomonas chitinilytica]
MAREGDSAREAMARACADAVVVARFWSKVVDVDGSGCRWWTGALSGRGHGRFWLGDGRVVVAHRFAFALAKGAEAADAVAVLGHRCDNPLCQRVGEGHIVASSHALNRREWVARRGLADSPLGDPRGARLRAQDLRDRARRDPALVAAALRELRRVSGRQLTLW